MIARAGVEVIRPALTGGWRDDRTRRAGGSHQRERVAKAMMTTAPAIARVAPTRFGPRWALPFNCPEPDERCCYVDAAVCGIRPPSERRINARQRKCETDQTGDAEHDDKGSRTTPYPHPERKAAGDFEERRERKQREVDTHNSSNAATNSRVPGGPVRSRITPCPSGSTVIVKRRNRQHWRSASTAPTIFESVSLEGSNRRRRPSGRSSRPADRFNSPKEKALLARF